MAYAALAVAAIAAISSVKSSQAKQEQNLTQANMNRYNAAIEQQQADTARSQSNLNEESQRRRAAIALGRQRAGMIEAGDGLSGSALDIYKQSAADAELDALNIRYGGEQQYQGLSQRASLDRWSGDNYEKEAKKISKNTALNAGTTALSAYYGYAG